MATSDTRPKDAGHLALGSALLLWLAAIAVWFVCWFLVPKYEAYLMDTGLRPSVTVRGLLVASHSIAEYFWWSVPILGAFFFLSGKTRAASRETSG